MALSFNVSVPGAIPDLDTLKSTVSDWLDRDDIDAKIPTFIQLAEAMFNREIRAPQMEKTWRDNVTAEDTNLPDDYLAMRAIYLEGSPDRPLRGMAPSAERQEFDGTAGDPQAYTLVSGVLRLIPPPSSQVLIVMDYWAEIQSLSVVNPSNWLLLQHPDAYLFATLMYAEAYLGNKEQAEIWKETVGPSPDGRGATILDRIGRANRADRYGAGPLVPNTAVQVRQAKC